MNLLTGIVLFILILGVIEAVYLAFRTIRNPEKEEVQRRLSALAFRSHENGEIDLVRKRMLSEVPWLNRMLLSFGWTNRLYLLLEQAGIQRPLGLFILISIFLALCALLIGLWITPRYIIIIPVAVFMGSLPFLYIYSKKNRRMKKFESQLPDAMDLIARSLKAGHAFSSGLKMVGDEFGDPVGAEFAKTVNEINLGVGVVDALKNLLNRVDCPDLNFFVISVVIQRETGGNLAEILENISRLVRERFKLHGRVRVLSAEGRLSAIILAALPFVIAFALAFLSPGYIVTLITDPIGNIMIGLALLLIIMGYLVMRRMIKIEV
jgi:tight adherence protein B